MEKGLKIIGISVRTTNQDNQSSQDVGQLWERFYTENSQNGENSEVEVCISVK